MIQVLKRRSVRLSLLTAIIPIIIQLLYVRFASYSVSEEDFGEFVLIINMVSGIAALLLITPLSALDRFYNSVWRKNEFISEISTLVFLFSILGVILLISSIYIYNIPYMYLVYLALILVINNLASLNKSILQISLNRSAFLSSSISDKIARMVIPFFFYYVFNSVESLVVGYLVGIAIMTAYTSYLVKYKNLKFKFSKYKFKFYFNYSYPLFLITGSSWVISLSDRYLIAYYMNIEDVAIYSIFCSVAGFGSIVGSIFTIYVYPLVMKGYSINKKESLVKYKQYLGYSVYAFVLGFLCILFLVPDQVIYLLIKPDNLNSSYDWGVFYCLIVATIITVFQTISSYYFSLYKKNLIFSLFWVVSATINVIVNIILIPEIGILGAALSTIVAYIFLLSSSFYWLKKYQLKIAL